MAFLARDRTSRGPLSDAVPDDDERKALASAARALCALGVDASERDDAQHGERETRLVASALEASLRAMRHVDGCGPFPSSHAPSTASSSKSQRAPRTARRRRVATGKGRDLHEDLEGGLLKAKSG